MLVPLSATFFILPFKHSRLTALSFSFLSSTSIPFVHLASRAGPRSNCIRSSRSLQNPSSYHIFSSRLYLQCGSNVSRTSIDHTSEKKLSTDAMARLLAWTSLVAGALATMPSYGSSYGSQTVEIQIGITLVSSCMGGGAPMNTMAPPPMATTGMTHQVRVPEYSTDTKVLTYLGYCWWRRWPCLFSSLAQRCCR